MSWNDQGNNNGSRDPWGRNNNPPPDIDELIKKFRAQINSIFGGGSGDGGGGICLLYTSPSPRDMRRSRMPSSA